MTLAKANARARAKAKHIYSTGVTYDRHLRLSKYFYSPGHKCVLHNFARIQPFIIVNRCGSMKHEHLITDFSQRLSQQNKSFS